MADFNEPQQPDLIAEPRAEYHAHETQIDREAYRSRLKLLLQDPEFRKIEGFPIGTDEAILQLSDPPYYTACPNPFMGEILEEWLEERRQTRKSLDLPDDERQPELMGTRQPFAADISEGKNDPIYNAHSYHTKVPHKAIMRYILHYTDPGDIVFDGFCGTGMTGVAAHLCGDKKTVESLGYQVRGDKVLDAQGKPVSRLGTRKSVLADLSPAATFIAYNYNTPMDTRAFELEAKRILKEVEKEFGWMYETYHSDGKKKGRINYTVWSEIFVCSNCGHELNFWEQAFNKETGHVFEEFSCSFCNIVLKKDALELLFDVHVDPQSGITKKVPRRKPVLINYTVDQKKYEKTPDEYDIEILNRIDTLSAPAEIPAVQLPDMQMARVGRMKTTGVTYINDFFLSRQSHSLAALWRKAQSHPDKRLKNFLLFFVEQAVWGLSILNRYQPIMHGRLGGSQVNRALSGVFYVASIMSEVSPWYNLQGKLDRLHKTFSGYRLSEGASLLQTHSLSSIKQIPDNSVDYIFTDPPFGENIYYSDLNILIESWLGVRTAPEREAIIDKVKGKGFQTYQIMMQECFQTYYMALKPGKWITVEFHNSKNSVWNAILQSMQDAGFTIADVRMLNKIQHSFQQATSAGAVKQDLVISAYKPGFEFEKKFRDEAGSVQGAWNFVRQHLENLPMPAIKDGVIEPTQERLPYLMYDRMVAFHIQRGINVPLSAPEFYQGLPQRFLEREGMIFNPIQAAAYDKMRLQADRIAQLALFITDESSARQWIRQELEPTSGHGPQTYGELQPRFVQHLHQSKYEALPELKVLLEQSFLQDEAGRWYNPDPDRQADLEALRLRALLHEFNDYRRSKGRLKVFRSEAIRAGFSQAWRERQYDIIVEIAERMPEAVLQEDQQLLMYYHNASLRQSKKPKQESLL